MDVHVRIVAKGLVQGVGFRWFVSQRAQRLDLRGYVRNTRDGNVEIEAQGNRSLVEELIKDVKIGPRSARVSDVSIEWMKENKNQLPSGFEIR